MLFGADIGAVRAENLKNGYYTYKVLEDGTASIISCDDNSAEIVIPQFIDGYEVSSIGKSAFANHNNLISVVIPSGIKEIGERAFRGCSNLTTIEFSPSVVIINQDAFYGCTKLKDVYFMGSREEYDVDLYEGNEDYESAKMHYGARVSESESDGATYSESDYTYMYLVTTKKDNWQYQEWDNGYHKAKYYDKFSYKYDENGLLTESNRNSSKPDITDVSFKTGKTSYQYDEDKNLLKVDGPYFDFSYTYNNGKIVKYNMFCREANVYYKGPHRFKHKLIYKKKDRSIYNPDCGLVSLLAKRDKYFFNRFGKVTKMYHLKNAKHNKKTYPWSSKMYYSYDKKGNLSKLKSVDQTSDSGMMNYTNKYKLMYKRGHLTKRKKTKPSVNDITSTFYKYKKVKILKKYKQQVEEQQWRILNFDDLNAFGIDQPWKY